MPFGRESNLKNENGIDTNGTMYIKGADHRLPITSLKEAALKLIIVLCALHIRCPCSNICRCIDRSVVD